jgi:hypothetical protein
LIEGKRRTPKARRRNDMLGKNDKVQVDKLNFLQGRIGIKEQPD